MYRFRRFDKIGLMLFSVLPYMSVFENIFTTFDENDGDIVILLICITILVKYLFQYGGFSERHCVICNNMIL